MKLNVRVITLEGNQQSTQGMINCLSSVDTFVKGKKEVKPFTAVTPETIKKTFTNRMIRWNYPLEAQFNTYQDGVRKEAYRAADPRKVVACACSHYELWNQCASGFEPFLILEHDAIFLKPFEFEKYADLPWDVLGINNPIGATRKAREWDAYIQRDPVATIQHVPTMDDKPCGLAGNSAYIIKPEGAYRLLEAVDKYGLWPNDAIMCNQIIANLYSTTTYYTGLQRMGSSTTS